MSLRGNPVVETAELPDGRAAEIRVGVPDDLYVPPADLDTVVIEVRIGEEVVAGLNTVLDRDQESEARALAREVAEGLTSGRLEPTAGAIEPLAEQVRSL
jgi:hypothetical protein